MRLTIFFTLLFSFIFSLIAQESNPVDRAECELIEVGDKLGKVIDENAKKSLNPCKGEDRPLSERLDTQLKEDAKKIKSFFGFQHEAEGDAGAESKESTNERP